MTITKKNKLQYRELLDPRLVKAVKLGMLILGGTQDTKPPRGSVQVEFTEFRIHIMY